MDKSKAIDAAISQIERQFGKGSIMRMGDEKRQSVASIPTGALALDLALGVGGIPRGRVVEIFGPESSGKTTLALHVIAEAQKAGASPPSSTPSTPWTRPTPRPSASTSRTSTFPSRITVNRPWR